MRSLGSSRGGKVVIGLTGSLACGKTTVAGMLKKMGAYVIDADKIAHRFIDAPRRKRLAQSVFDDKEALKRLCRRIHPLVKEEIARRLKRLKRPNIAVVDAPLLVESGFDKKCDYLVVVKTPLRKQLERAEKKLSLGAPEALKRIRLQMPLKEKISRADFVIDNGGSLKDTERQARKVWKKIIEQGEIWKKLTSEN